MVRTDIVYADPKIGLTGSWCTHVEVKVDRASHQALVAFGLQVEVDDLTDAVQYMAVAVIDERDDLHLAGVASVGLSPQVHLRRRHRQINRKAAEWAGH